MQETLNSISLGPLWLEYLLFFVISYVNVVLQNLKYIFLIKSTKLKAAGIGMVTSIFYASVVVMIAKHELVSILIVAMTHFLGIYTARLISESLEKKGYLKKNEQVWDCISYLFIIMYFNFIKTHLDLYILLDLLLFLYYLLIEYFHHLLL